MTNTVGVRELPERLDAVRRGVDISEAVEKRVEDLVWSCFIGDATQVRPGERLAVKIPVLRIRDPVPF
jgi:hypothetical protein